MYTQEQLEGMSDNDIDNKVAQLIGLNNGYRDKVSTTCTAMVHVKRVSKDYCNNWAYMGPLIKETSINLINREHNLWCARKNTNSVKHSNPLRAAAIVYILVMQERNK